MSGDANRISDFVSKSPLGFSTELYSLWGTLCDAHAGYNDGMARAMEETHGVTPLNIEGRVMDVLDLIDRTAHAVENLAIILDGCKYPSWRLWAKHDMASYELEHACNEYAKAHGLNIIESSSIAGHKRIEEALREEHPDWYAGIMRDLAECMDAEAKFAMERHEARDGLLCTSVEPAPKMHGEIAFVTGDVSVGPVPAGEALGKMADAIRVLKRSTGANLDDAIKAMGGCPEPLAKPVRDALDGMAYASSKLDALAKALSDTGCSLWEECKGMEMAVSPDGNEARE